jgi:hypothetical protein
MIEEFICIDGEKINCEDCLKKCRVGVRCAPYNYLTLCKAERQWDRKPSVTQLIIGTREAYLKIKYGYAINPDSSAFKIIGSRGHSLLENQEKYNDINALLEEKLEWQGIKGTPDSLIQENNKYTLVDYKVSGSYKLSICLQSFEVPLVNVFGEIEKYVKGPKKGQTKYEKVLSYPVENPSQINHEEMKDWIMQLNMYRLLYKFNGFDVDEMKIFVVVRDGNTYIAKSRGVKRNTYYFPVPFVDDIEVTKFFFEKRDKLIYHVESDKIPSYCNEHESWGGKKCQEFCEVRGICEEIG